MTRADAEEFLKQHDGNLNWENTEAYPSPPLDRVELARMLLENLNPAIASSQALFTEPFSRKHLWLDIGIEWLVYSDTNLLVDKGWQEHYYPPKTLGELFQILEGIYLAHWERGWRCGANSDAFEKVRLEINDALRTVLKRPDMLFQDTERISGQLTALQCYEFCKKLDWMDREGQTRLVHRGKSRLTATFEIILMIGGLTLFLLALLGFLNGWFAVLGVIGLLGVVVVSSMRTGHFVWTEPELTFGKLVEALQERAQDEYDAMVEAGYTSKRVGSDADGSRKKT